MKIDWSKLNKMHFVVWYIITIFVILGIASLTNNVMFAIITGHIGYLLFMSMSITEYVVENKSK